MRDYDTFIVLSHALVLRGYLHFQELGLLAGTPVGTSLIDAHAGGVGVMESVPISDSEVNGLYDLSIFSFSLMLTPDLSFFFYFFFFLSFFFGESFHSIIFFSRIELVQ